MVSWLALILSLLLAQPPPPPPVSVPGFDTQTVREAEEDPPVEVPPPPGAEPLQVTVEQAVRLAWDRNPNIAIARGNLWQREGLVEQQNAGLLPKLTGSATYLYLDQAAGGSTVSGGFVTASSEAEVFTTGVSLSQLVWDFQHTANLVRQADLQRAAAAASLLQSFNDTALDVKNKFYTLLQQQRLEEVSLGDLRVKQKQLRMTRALFEAGQASAGDVVRAQTTVSDAVFAYNNARQETQLARQALALSLGMDPRTPLTVADQPEPVVAPAPLEELVTAALADRPDVIAAERNVEASEAGLRAAETTNLPSISTTAQYQWQGITGGPYLPTLQAQAAVNFDLYDGGQRDGAIRQAEGQLLSDHGRASQARLQAQSDVTEAYVRLLTAERNLDAADDSVRSAEEAVRIAEGRYLAALGTFTDVLQAQQALLVARRNRVSNQTVVDQARASLRHALAKPF